MCVCVCGVGVGGGGGGGGNVCAVDQLLDLGFSIYSPIHSLIVYFCQLCAMICHIMSAWLSHSTPTLTSHVGERV